MFEYWTGWRSKLRPASFRTKLGIITNEQAGNRQVSIDLIKLVLLANACRVAIRIDFTNQDDALAIMGMTKDALDE